MIAAIAIAAKTALQSKAAITIVTLRIKCGINKHLRIFTIVVVMHCILAAAIIKMIVARQAATNPKQKRSKKGRTSSGNMPIPALWPVRILLLLAACVVASSSLHLKVSKCGEHGSSGLKMLILFQCVNQSCRRA